MIWVIEVFIILALSAMALPVMISLVANPLNATSLMLGIVLWSGYLVWLWNIFKTMIKGKEKRGG